MQLEHLTERSCATCAAPAIRDEAAPQAHCNGTREESRTFACGRKVHYSPNFRRVEVACECPMSPAVEKQRQAQGRSG